MDLGLWIESPTPLLAHASEVPAASSVSVAARSLAGTWVDGAGNFWVFGGFEINGHDVVADYNSFWEFSGAGWNLMGGTDTIILEEGTYGTLGVASPAKLSGGANSSVSWTDPAGNFWLFGGFGYDSTGNYGNLNDLWKYSAGEWTWMGGSNLANQPATYGTVGVPSAANIPGPRGGGVARIDASGNVWLFGGLGGDSTGAYGFLNDLWEYSGGLWTWVSRIKFGGTTR